MREANLFLTRRSEFLGARGFKSDPGIVERTPGGVVFYHYTRQEHVDTILHVDGGLKARRPVVWSELSPEFANGHFAEGFLEPFPRWLADSPYFGDLGLEMMREYVGDFLLRIEVPEDFAGLYVADCAHALECKHALRRGHPVLGLGYDCSNGRDATKAVFLSQIPLIEYRGGHVAPEVYLVRPGVGIVVPSRFIRVADQQPLR